MAKKHSNNGRRIPAVGYIRMSSDKQEASPGQQRDEITKLAAREGYRILRWYVDEGISGDATEKRKDFQRMIADAERGEFKAILCWDQDRFGRFDSIEAGRWIYPLREAGIHLVTVNDGVIDWSDFAGRMIYSIKQEGKHEFLRDLSRNVLRGKLAAAKRGEWQGRAPLGYRVENKRLVLGDPEDVQTIHDIFAWYLRGDSLRAIMRRLNDQGKTNRGFPWTPTTVKRKLTCVTYTGTFRWNDQRRGKYHSIADDAVVSPQNGSNPDDWIVIPNNHPAIIDQQTFEAAQERLRKRRLRTTPHANGGEFLFTGLLRCGRCDGNMFGNFENKTKQVSYICQTRQNTGKCERNTAKQDELLTHVVDAVVERFANPDVEQRLRDELHRQVKSTSSKTSVASIRKQLASIDSKFANAKCRLVEVDSDLVGIVQDRIRELARKRNELLGTLKAASVPLEQVLNEADARVNAAMKSFTRLRETLERADTVLLRELLSEAIDKVEVWSKLVVRGRRRVFELQRGVIHLRGTQLKNLLHSSRRRLRRRPSKSIRPDWR
jgi:site-specific DNA recombinase